MKLFENTGFYVFRTAGSHGIADVIAVNADEVIFIQCKYGVKPTKDERIKMYNFHVETFPNVNLILAHRKPREKIKFYEFDDMTACLKEANYGWLYD